MAQDGRHNRRGSARGGCATHLPVCHLQDCSRDIRKLGPKVYIYKAVPDPLQVRHVPPLLLGIRRMQCEGQEEGEEGDTYFLHCRT